MTPIFAPVTVDPSDSSLVGMNVGPVTSQIYIKNLNVRYMVSSDPTGTFIRFYKTIDNGVTWTTIDSVVPLGSCCVAGTIIRAVVGNNTGFDLYEFDTSVDMWSGIISSVVIIGFNINVLSFQCAQLGTTLYVAGTWIAISAVLAKAAFLTFTGGVWTAPVLFANASGGALGAVTGGLTVTDTRVQCFVSCYETTTTGAIYQSELTTGAGAINRITGTDFIGSTLQPPPNLGTVAYNQGTVMFPYFFAATPNVCFFYEATDASVLVFTFPPVQSMDLNTGSDPGFGILQLNCCAYALGFIIVYAAQSTTDVEMFYGQIGNAIPTSIGTILTDTNILILICGPATLTSFSIGWVGV